MKTEDRIEQGKKLIQGLKDHLIRCLRSHPKGSVGVSVKELQNYSGLTIKGRTGGEVWFMAVVTLLVDLWKEKKIRTQPDTANTKKWKPHHKVWISK